MKTIALTALLAISLVGCVSQQELFKKAEIECRAENLFIYGSPNFSAKTNKKKIDEAYRCLGEQYPKTAHTHDLSGLAVQLHLWDAVLNKKITPEQAYSRYLDWDAGRYKQAASHRDDSLAWMALGAKILENNRPYTLPHPAMNSGMTRTNCRMFGQTLSCTSF